MNELKRGWKAVPSSIRKPIVLVTGSFFIVASALLGWLPGPGGIPLFLIGIAILSTEYTWARKLRDTVLGYIHAFGIWYRRHRVLGTLLIIACVAAVLAFGTFAYAYIW